MDYEEWRIDGAETRHMIRRWPPFHQSSPSSRAYGSENYISKDIRSPDLCLCSGGPTTTLFFGKGTLGSDATEYILPGNWLLRWMN